MFNITINLNLIFVIQVVFNILILFALFKIKQINKNINSIGEKSEKELLNLYKTLYYEKQRVEIFEKKTNNINNNFGNNLKDLFKCVDLLKERDEEQKQKIKEQELKTIKFDLKNRNSIVGIREKDIPKINNKLLIFYKTIEIRKQKNIFLYPLSKEQQKCFDKIIKTGKNYFIQGAAGTGKSNFIKHLKKHFQGRILLCSPTALSAININGSTIHKEFLLPPRDIYYKNNIIKFKGEESYRGVQIIIIDEISMVRADVLDAIDYILKKVLETDKLFGGKQVILVGDLYQLPPIFKSEVKDIFKDRYGVKEPLFFVSNSYKNGNFTKVIFNEVFRQNDANLLKFLTNIRECKNEEKTADYFNTLKIEDREILQRTTYITPFKENANKKNQIELSKINEVEYLFKSEKEGTFNFLKSDSLPSPEELVLKVGTLIMFNKNDSEGNQFYNGQQGTIADFLNYGDPDKEFIVVKLLTTNREVVVKKMVWESFKYQYNKK